MEKFNPGKFDKVFIDIVENLADALEVDPVVFIENVVIKRLAEDRAADDVYGVIGLNIMPEFVKHDSEVMRGRQLYEMLYNLELQKFTRERLEQIQETLKYLTFDQLHENDQEFMKQQGKDPASIESRAAEKVDVDKLREKYNIPKQRPGQNSHWEK